jgi:outer membrane biosynthesis protein TonB
VLLSSPIPGQQQLSEEEKKRLFLKAARGDDDHPLHTTYAAICRSEAEASDDPVGAAPTVVKPPTPAPTPVPAPQPTPSTTPPPVKIVPPLRPNDEPKAPIVVRETGVAEADEKDGRAA